MEKINKVLFTADQSSDFTKSQQATARNNIGIPRTKITSYGLVLKNQYDGSVDWGYEQCSFDNDYNSSMTEATATDNTNGYYLYTFPENDISGYGLLMLYRMSIVHESRSERLTSYYTDLEIYHGDATNPTASLIHKINLLVPGPNGLSDDEACYQIVYPGTWYSGNLWTCKFIKASGVDITGAKVLYSSSFVNFREYR